MKKREGERERERERLKRGRERNYQLGKEKMLQTLVLNPKNKNTLEIM